SRTPSEPRIRAGCHGSPSGSPPAITRWILWYWLDSAADPSSTNSTQAYWVDGEHQPTDLAAWRLESVVACPWLLAWWLTCLGRWVKVTSHHGPRPGGRRAMQHHAAGAGGPPSSPTSRPGRPHRLGLVRLV